MFFSRRVRLIICHQSHQGTFAAHHSSSFEIFFKPSQKKRSKNCKIYILGGFRLKVSTTVFTYSQSQTFFITSIKSYLLVERSVQHIYFSRSTVAANAIDLSLNPRRLVVNHLISTSIDHF